jgi:hypothetical protein
METENGEMKAIKGMDNIVSADVVESVFLTTFKQA